MGMSGYVRLILGAEVQTSEVFDETTSVPFKCASCATAYEQRNKFCGECGLRFAQVTRTLWKSQVLKALYRRKCRLGPEDTTAAYFDAPVFAVDEGSIVFGHELLELSCAHDKTTARITFAQLDGAKARVKTMFDEMGLPERELLLFQLTSVH